MNKTFKGGRAEDPRGLIYEAYQIEDATHETCRAIFFEWAVAEGSDGDSREKVIALYEHYRDAHPQHPMTWVLEEGVNQVKERGTRRGRRRD